MVNIIASAGQQCFSEMLRDLSTECLEKRHWASRTKMGLLRDQ